MRTSAALWLATLATACIDQTVVSPNANVVVVHAVIDASAKDQYVAVQTTTGVETQQHDVSGAHVTLATPDGGSFAATEVIDTVPSPFQGAPATLSRRYKVSFAQIGAIVPDGTYRLHIVLPDGREVNAATTVPSALPATTSTVLPDLDFSRDTLSLSWHGSKGASAYEVFIESSRSSFSVFADTTVSVPGRADNAEGRPAFWAGLSHRIIVSAVDANYYDYYRRTSDEFTGRGLITHLDGAVGVFGSIVPVASYSLMVR